MGRNMYDYRSTTVHAYVLLVLEPVICRLSVFGLLGGINFRARLLRALLL